MTDEGWVQVHPRLPVELVTRIDLFARQRGITRVAAIKVLLAKAVGMNGPESGSGWGPVQTPKTRPPPRTP